MRSIYLLCLILFTSCMSSAQTFEGVWRGDFEIQGQKLPLVFWLKKVDTTSWGGFMQSPAQSPVKIPLSSVEIAGDVIKVEVKNLGLRYSGQLKNGKIVGTFKQGSISASLDLLPVEETTTAKRVSLERSQKVKAPYSYDTLSVRVKNTYDAVDLAGTLTFPKAKKKYPAVLLVTGSGPQNRDEEIFGHQPFRVLADYLTKNGIVVLRMDDRGVGESKGNFESSTIENFSKDAMAAFSFLKNQTQVDKDRVGIIGHSEGALIAELLAGQQLPDLSFVVALAGPSFAIDKMMVEQLYAVGKAAGLSEQALLQARAINEKNFAVVKSDLGTEDAYRQLLKNMAATQIGNQNLEMDKELMTMLTPAYRYFMRIEPERYLPQIRIPIFAAFGTLDVQVPSDVNLRSLNKWLVPNTKTVFKEYEGLNHLFQRAKTGQVQEYVDIAETINPQVMEDITIWIKGL